MVFDYGSVEERKVNRDFKWGGTFRTALTDRSFTKERVSLISGTSDFAPKYVNNWHSLRGQEMPMPGMGCLISDNVIVFRHGQILVNDLLVIDEEFMPIYVRNILNLESGYSPEIEKFSKFPTIDVEDPTVVLCGHGARVYGHFLIEMMFRIVAAQEFCHCAGIEAPKYLLEATTPNWLFQILSRHFGIAKEDTIIYSAGRERVRLNAAIVPEYSYSNTLGGFDRLCDEMTDRILNRVTGGIRNDVSRIFITRLVFESRQGRWKCNNELELIRIASREFGFTPLFVENMSWRDQLISFASAKSIIGEFGSGLHTAIFSKANTCVGALGVANMMQSFIGTMKGHQNAYIAADTTAEFEIEPSQFRDFLEAIVGAERS